MAFNGAGSGGVQAPRWGQNDTSEQDALNKAWKKKMASRSGPGNYGNLAPIPANPASIRPTKMEQSSVDAQYSAMQYQSMQNYNQNALFAPQPHQAQYYPSAATQYNEAFGYQYQPAQDYEYSSQTMHYDGGFNNQAAPGLEYRLDNAKYGQGYDHQVTQMIQPNWDNACQQDSLRSPRILGSQMYHGPVSESSCSTSGPTAPRNPLPYPQPGATSSYMYRSNDTPPCAPTGPKNSGRNQNDQRVGRGGNWRCAPRSTPAQEPKEVRSAFSQRANESPPVITQRQVATASMPVPETDATSLTVELQRSQVPYEPSCPEPDVAFFNQIGAYTFVVVEPSGNACSDCKRYAKKIRLAKAQVAIVLNGRKITSEYISICQHSLQKLFKPSPKTKIPQGCLYCTISFFQYRQAQFIERLTKATYIGRRNTERNYYLPPMDELDKDHVNWTAPSIPNHLQEAYNAKKALTSTEESKGPASLEHSQEGIEAAIKPEKNSASEVSKVPTALEHSEEAMEAPKETLIKIEESEISDVTEHSDPKVIEEPDEITNSKVEELLVHSNSEVVELQNATIAPMSKGELEICTFEPMEVEMDLKTSKVPKLVKDSKIEPEQASENSSIFWNPLGFWITFCFLSLGMLIAFSGALNHILQAGPTLPPVALNITQSEWDYVYVPPVPEELPLPIPSSLIKKPQSTTTSTPTGTSTHPSDPTPSPARSLSTYDTIIGTASMAVNTPEKIIALVAGVSFVLGMLHFGPSVIESFTE